MSDPEPELSEPEPESSDPGPELFEAESSDPGPELSSSCSDGDGVGVPGVGEGDRSIPSSGVGESEKSDGVAGSEISCPASANAHAITPTATANPAMAQATDARIRLFTIPTVPTRWIRPGKAGQSFSARRRTSTRVPRPTSLVTEIEPPHFSARSRAIASPSPEPPRGASPPR